MPEFRVTTIASGSSGNCVYAENAEGALLIDAGLSGKKIVEGLRAIGSSIERVGAIVITHEHIDHIRGAGVLHRRYGIPLFMSRGTLNYSRRKLGKVNEVSTFNGGDTLGICGFAVHTIGTPHDAGDPVAIILERNNGRCGILTDLGNPFQELIKILPTLDAVVLESNYDPEMLTNGPYPRSLQQRIKAAHGHISNNEAGELIRDHAGDRLGVALLAHLSENNNCPDLALKTVREVANEKIAINKIRVSVAPRHMPSETIITRRNVS